MNVLARTSAAVRPKMSDFALDAIAGLSAEPKTLPAKYFYDDRGSALFEAITAVPEYYPTRTELGILRERAGEIAQLIPPGGALIEFGSGSTAKARIVLDAAAVAAYVPVDISAGFLSQEAARLGRDLPGLRILPIAADFTKPFELPPAIRLRARVGFFPGSTIGNFEPPEAARFLRHAAALLGRGAHFIVGVDLIKDVAVLDAAYDDAAGVTAAFNLNLLKRINRELGANFDLDKFMHYANYRPIDGSARSFLISRERQTVRIEALGRDFEFDQWEAIFMEISQKYHLKGIAELAVKS